MWLAVPGILKRDLFGFTVNKLLALCQLGKGKPEGAEWDTATNHRRRNDSITINSF